LNPQLFEHLDGKAELRRGSWQDRAEARKWMSLFYHKAVVGNGSVTSLPPSRKLQKRACGGRLW
jgi:hypothetical protein